MRAIDPHMEGVRTFDCYENRTDDPSDPGRGLIIEGETLLALTDEEKIFMAAALQLAANVATGRYIDQLNSSEPVDSPEEKTLYRYTQRLNALAKEFAQFAPPDAEVAARKISSREAKAAGRTA